MNPRLSVIIPAYNEALRIGPTLEAVSKYLSSQNYPSEIIIVDDGSKDETKKVVKRFPNVRLIENDQNHGKGFSVKEGMLAAKGDLRLFMDADHSVKIENIDRFINEIEKGADIVIASIEIPGSTIIDDNHGYRRVFGHWSKGLIRAMATKNIHDTQRGFKLFTQKAAEALFPKLMIHRWGFDIEILRRAQKTGFIIKELPVDWANSRASSVKITSYFTTLYELIKICLCV